MTTTNETANTAPVNDQTIAAMDAAVAAAKARKDAKKAGASAPGAEGASTETNATASKRKVFTPEERAAKLAGIEADRAARKEKRTSERTAKQAATAATRAPAHMKKVQKAAEALGTLSETAQAIFGEATSSLSTAEVQALASHLQHHARVQATSAALEVKLEVGQTVTIVTGDQRYIGKEGKLTKVNRLRCYVAFDGQDKPGYFFTSDVKVTAAAPAAEIATETPSTESAAPEAPASSDAAAA